jgi:hypothetical protein
LEAITSVTTLKMKQNLECIMVEMKTSKDEMKSERRRNNEKVTTLQGPFTWVDVH